MNYLTVVYRAIRRDRMERHLFWGCFVAFVVYLIQNYHLPVPSCVTNKFLENVLTNESMRKLVGDLTLGVSVSYFFYVFTVVLPRALDVEKKLKTLNTALLLIIRSFKKDFNPNDLRPFSTILDEPDINPFSLEDITDCKDYLNNNLGRLNDDEANRIRSCIKIRIGRLSNMSELSSHISLRHSLIWLDLIYVLEKIIETPEMSNTDLSAHLLSICNESEDWLNAS